MVAFSLMHCRDMDFEFKSLSKSFAAVRTFMVAFYLMLIRDMGFEMKSSNISFFA